MTPPSGALGDGGGGTTLDAGAAVAAILMLCYGCGCTASWFRCLRAPTLLLPLSSLVLSVG